MIVRHLKDAKQSQRKVVSPDGKWDSVRLLLRDDNMGFSFHITTIKAGEELHMHYQNHLESVYCISGRGEIEDLQTEKRHRIEPGVVYALDKHDKHILRAESELQLACVFNPPLSGQEVHNEAGSYELV